MADRGKWRSVFNPLNIVLAGCVLALVFVCLLTGRGGTASENLGLPPVVSFVGFVVSSVSMAALLAAIALYLSGRWNRRTPAPRWGLGSVFGKWSGQGSDEFPFVAPPRGDADDSETGSPRAGARESDTPLAAEARGLLADWRGDAYAFGLGCLADSGPLTRQIGRRAILVANSSRWMAPVVETVIQSLAGAGVEIAARCEGAAANSPLEDVYRIQDEIVRARPEVIVAVGGGSTIDAVKAAAALSVVSPATHDVAPLFGVGRVTERLGSVALTPIVAVETAASSGSHLTKYANVTDLAAGQKSLIVDMALVPRAAVFDYSVTVSATKDLTCDGAFDAMSHLIEVYYGAKGEALEKADQIAMAGVRLIVSSVADVVREPGDLAAREALGLGSDLGGYAIMVGSTSGGHLTSFSLVDVTTHGRATAILNPYYTVLFSAAIQRQLRRLLEVYKDAGLAAGNTMRLSGRDLAVAVAEAMMALSRRLGYPTSLHELPGFTAAHIDRAIAAAKTPQLAMKLQAMPVPMDAATVERHMRPLLEAAAEGDVRKIVTMK